MGIRGLTTFILERSHLYLEPFKLKDSYLVVDGYNTVYSLFRWHTNDSSAFGGDYDVYCEVVRNFFTILLKCNVTPIVIFDGGHEIKKLETILQRNTSRLTQLKTFLETYSSDKFVPLFLVEVFRYVIHEMEITCIQCFYEADKEIAALARTLNCPVLSYDSDFFIFDVNYIPFTTLILHPEEVEISASDKKFFLKCSIFTIDNFLNNFEGLKKPLLPLLAPLLGNDYINSSVFNKLFKHISIPKNKRESYHQNKVLAVLNWLKHEETLESAKSLILTHIQKKEANKALKAIIEAVNDYSNYSCTVLSFLNIENIKANDEDYQEQYGQSKENKSKIKENYITLKLPNDFIKLYQKCKIQSFVMDMLSLNCYFSPTQIEDLNKPSCHMLSFPIISAIYILLKSFLDEYNTLKIYMRVKNNYTKVEIKNLDFGYFEGIKIDNLLHESKIVKRNFLYKVLNLNENDKTVLDNFDNNWILFVMSFIYWKKNLSEEISQEHVYALLLMVICNFVQNKVGYYKDYSTFMNRKSKKIKRLSQKNILTYDYSKCQFSELLNHISELEYLILTKLFIKFRRISKNHYFISFIHLNACFQSCLFHILQLNTILNYPFPDLNVSQFYSGTMLYNLYYKFHHEPNVNNYIMNQLTLTPNVANLYKFLLDKLWYYVSNCTKPEFKKKRNKRHKKKKKIEQKEKEISNCNLQSDIEGYLDEDYFDKENIFSLLQSSKSDK